MYDAGVKSFKVLSRVRFTVWSAGEFLVYGCSKGKRVELLGPPRVTDRRFDYLDSSGRFSSIEVEASKAFEAHVYTRERGEDLDHTPVAVPVNAGPPTLREQVRDLVAHELSLAAGHAGAETFEEADDFDVDEDEDNWVSPYEIREMAFDELEPKADASRDENGSKEPGSGEAQNLDKEGGAAPPGPGDPGPLESPSSGS